MKNEPATLLKSAGMKAMLFEPTASQSTVFESTASPVMSFESAPMSAMLFESTVSPATPLGTGSTGIDYLIQPFLNCETVFGIHQFKVKAA